MIDLTAIVHPTAQLAEGVQVGPYSIIKENTVIGVGTVIGPHVVIGRNTTLGEQNKIYQFASVGEDPQDLKYAGEDTHLVMGDHNMVREGVTIHRGTIQDESVTTIGDYNLFMANAHIAHDCRIGHHCVFANTAAVAGHAWIGNHVIVSGFCGIHQFCKVGDFGFIAHASLVTKDIPPYLMITGGGGAKVCGLNQVGLKRHGFSDDDLLALKRAYKLIYRQAMRTEEALERLKDLVELSDKIQPMIDFIAASKRGILR